MHIKTNKVIAIGIIVILLLVLILLIVTFSNHRTRKKEVLEIAKTITVNLSKDNFEELCLRKENSLIGRNENRNYQFVAYFDSINCSSCVIKHIGMWSSIISHSEEMGIEYYFIFAPKKNEMASIRSAYRDSHFLYPILLDSIGTFEKENPFVKCHRELSFFLMDYNNKIVYVGNPANDYKSEERYYNFLESLRDDSIK